MRGCGCWGISCIIIIIMFIDDNSFVWCSPFIEYYVARVVNFVRCMVDKFESLVIWHKAKENAGE
jgi:hypothetical protein